MPSVTLLEKWTLLQAIFADADLSASAKLVAGRLLFHHSAQTGRCSPSYQTLAGGTGLTRRRAIGAVRELETCGWVEVQRVKGGDPSVAQGFVTNGFTINFGRLTAPPGVNETTLPRGEEIDTPPSVDLFTPPGEINSTPGVNETTLPGVNKTTPNTGKLTGKRKKDSPPTPSRFEEWWSIYPRREGKIAARKAFDQIIAKTLAAPDELITGAERYAVTRCGQDPQYTKLPTTWLNGGHWSDEAAPPRVRNGSGSSRGYSATGDWLQRRSADD